MEIERRGRRGCCLCRDPLMRLVRGSVTAAHASAEATQEELFSFCQVNRRLLESIRNDSYDFIEVFAWGRRYRCRLAQEVAPQCRPRRLNFPLISKRDSEQRRRGRSPSSGAALRGARENAGEHGHCRLHVVPPL